MSAAATERVLRGMRRGPSLQTLAMGIEGGARFERKKDASTLRAELAVAGMAFQHKKSASLLARAPAHL
jgi:hypothetical protein